ncbi:LOW QUALITY PROTEIN: nonsense-mediated mRNA decay factor SMG9 [Athene noctua]|uniref:LOW QUALITY PROTEIN: nonsense-mediated mRNA decay factor SMG9 n=1 Tax=Athene noctua TaxID=126797 RepID=UPI003EBCCB29
MRIFLTCKLRVNHPEAPHPRRTRRISVTSPAPTADAQSPSGNSVSITRKLRPLRLCAVSTPNLRVNHPQAPPTPRMPTSLQHRLRVNHAEAPPPPRTRHPHTRKHRVNHFQVPPSPRPLRPSRKTAASITLEPRPLSARAVPNPDAPPHPRMRTPTRKLRPLLPGTDSGRKAGKTPKPRPPPRIPPLRACADASLRVSLRLPSSAANGPCSPAHSPCSPSHRVAPPRRNFFLPQERRGRRLEIPGEGPGLRGDPSPPRGPPVTPRVPPSPPGSPSRPAAMSDSGQSPAPGARRRWAREKEPEGSGERREGGEEPPGLLQKTPIILAKPPGERQQVKAGPGPAPPPPTPAPPIVLMKARGEEGRAGGVATSGEGPTVAPPREREGPRPTQPVYQLHGRGLPPPGALDPVAGQARLAPPEKMKTSIKLVDEQMNWCDSALEFLLEQTDVLVVGALGLQGTGKSTVLSLLAGGQPEEDPRAFPFRAQAPELRERGGAQTGGIDLFVTQERVVLLDTQPILSPALLDHLINNDRKLPPEYPLPHTYIEMQSLQIAAFLFTVCHVVLLVQDWFTDLALYRFLQTAEMVKPSTPSPGHEPGAGPEEPSEYYPHLGEPHGSCPTSDPPDP